MKIKLTTLKEKKTFAGKNESGSGSLPVVGETRFTGGRSRGKKLKRHGREPFTR